jgi:G3E family GTPase
VCCSIRDDLRAALGELAAARVSGRIDFDRVVIETTGLADPVPVAQTFFLDDSIARDYRPDAIIAMVDGKFAMRQLDARIEAQRQVGFADRLFLTKLDLVTRTEQEALSNRLTAMNSQARQVAVAFGDVASTSAGSISLTGSSFQPIRTRRRARTARADTTVTSTASGRIATMISRASRFAATARYGATGSRSC